MPVEARADLVDFFFVSNIDKLEQSFIFLHSNIVALECFNYITSVLVDCIQAALNILVQLLLVGATPE